MDGRRARKSSASRRNAILVKGAVCAEFEGPTTYPCFCHDASEPVNADIPKSTTRLATTGQFVHLLRPTSTASSTHGMDRYAAVRHPSLKRAPLRPNPTRDKYHCFHIYARLMSYVNLQKQAPPPAVNLEANATIHMHGVQPVQLRPGRPRAQPNTPLPL